MKIKAYLLNSGLAWDFLLSNELPNPEDYKDKIEDLEPID